MIFLEKNKKQIIYLLIIYFIFKSCTISADLNKLNDKVKSLEQTSIPKSEMIKAIKIEGLKNEKRMIQSTDRKLLDVNREKEIDIEINKLEGK